MAQRGAFAAGVPPDICAFHRYTRNSPLPLPYSSHSSIEWPLWVEPRVFTPDLPNRLRALYAQ